MDILVITVDDTLCDLGGLNTKFIKVFVFCFGVAVIAEAIVVHKTTAITVFNKFVKF